MDHVTESTPFSPRLPCIKFCSLLLPCPLKAKSAYPKGKIILVKFMGWDLWRVYTSTCSLPSITLFGNAVPRGKSSCFFTMYVQQAYFAKYKTTAKLQTTLKFSDQGYKTEFQVSLPSILGPSMEPDSHCFLTLITKLQSHFALSGPSVFCKSIYPCDQHICICALKVSISKQMANVF